MSEYDGYLRADPQATGTEYDGWLRPDGPDTGDGPVFLDGTGGAKATVRAGATSTVFVTRLGGAAATATAGGEGTITTAGTSKPLKLLMWLTADDD